MKAFTIFFIYLKLVRVERERVEKKITSFVQKLDLVINYLTFNTILAQIFSFLLFNDLYMDKRKIKKRTKTNVF